MLTRARWRIGAVITALLGLIATTLVIASPAAADGTWCDPTSGRCYIVLSSPPSDPAPNPDSNGWTPGAPSCYRTDGSNPDGERIYTKVDCGNGQSYWSNYRQCYVQLAGYEPTRPPGTSADAGYYVCIPHPDAGFVGTPQAFWSETVPPGLEVLTPGAAAALLIEGFQLRGIDIGMAPEVNPEWGHRRGYVGVPVWLWVNNPEPLTWGPYTETATLGGQTITATAQATSVRWDMGDGSSTTCGNKGTPYNTGYGMTTSPTCGYQYTTTSSRTAGDRFTVTATTNWTVTWTSTGGANGTVNLTTNSAVDLEVNELQTVIVP